MPRCKVLIVFVVGFLVAGGTMAQDDQNQDTSLFGIPFLKLKNGGIRVQFGGYHAEAGLGGLLGGSRTGGGLHASAGTPWGANAAAGLGGALGGDDATAGGGLYARAGLGNGRPEAGAGLGGMLDGSGRSNAPASGGLFAGATTGSRTFAGATGSAGASGGASASGGATASSNAIAGGGISSNVPAGGRTNIQIISSSDKKFQKAGGEVAVGAPQLVAESQIREEGSVGKGLEDIQRLAFGPSAQAGLFGALYAQPTPGAIVKSVEKVKVVHGVDTVNSVPVVPSVPYQGNEIIVTHKHYHQRPIHPRWSYRKRFWAGFPRKQIIYAPAVDVGVQAETVVDKRKIVRRQIDNPDTQRQKPTETDYEPEERNNRNNDFFDDVFNIPMSAISAVNQLLKNNAS